MEADDTGEASDADEEEDELEEFLCTGCLTLKHWLRCGRAQPTLGEAQEEPRSGSETKRPQGAAATAVPAMAGSVPVRMPAPKTYFCVFATLREQRDRQGR